MVLEIRRLKEKGGKTTSLSENVKREPVKVKYNYGGKDYEIEFKTPPKKAISKKEILLESKPDFVTGWTNFLS